MQTVGVEGTGHLVADQLTHALTGHRAGQPGQQPAVRKRVVGGPATQMVDRRGGQPLLHQMVIQQFVLADSLQMRQAGTVPQHIADGDRVLAVGAELGPVRRDRLVVVQQAAVDQSVNDRRRNTFRRGEHHRAGVDGPWLFTRAVGPACPDVDDGPPVDVHRKCAAAEPPAREQTAKTLTTLANRESAAPCTPRGRPSSARSSDAFVIQLTMRGGRRGACGIAIFSRSPVGPPPAAGRRAGPRGLRL